MPRVKPLGKQNYEKILSAEMKASSIRKFMEWKDVAVKTGKCLTTVRTYANDPTKIPLEWLKRFINITEMDPDVILEYLYEGKYKVKRDL